MKPGHIDLGRTVLDHQIYDRDHLECGKVDDLELAHVDGVLRVTAVRTGPGVAAKRLPGWLDALAVRILGNSTTRIPWQEMEIIGKRLQLSIRARERRLDSGDRKLRWIERLPGAGKVDET